MEDNSKTITTFDNINGNKTDEDDDAISSEIRNNTNRNVTHSTIKSDSSSNMGETHYYEQVLKNAARHLKIEEEEGVIDEELLLKSLPQRPVARFPSEADRKRIVGILASILSCNNTKNKNARLVEVHCQFLVRTADWLFLDKSHALAFLPLLNNSPPKFHSGRHTKNNNEKNDTNDHQHPQSSGKDELRSKLKESGVTLPESDLDLLHCDNDEWGSFQMADEKESKTEEHPLQHSSTTIPRNTCNDNSYYNNNNNNNINNEKKDNTNTYTINNMNDNNSTKKKKKNNNSNNNNNCSLADYLYNSSDDASSSSGELEEDEEMTPMVQQEKQQKELTPEEIRLKIKVQHMPIVQEQHQPSLTPEEIRLKIEAQRMPIQQPEEEEELLWFENPFLQPFLDSLTPGAGIQTVSLLLLHHLLSEGYDARIRHILKKLAVVVFRHEYPCSTELYATRKFEALERGIAQRLINNSKNSTSSSTSSSTNSNNNSKNGKEAPQQQLQLQRSAILRGLKIGSAGVVAGTLFAVTGGLAAPGIAAGIAALGTTTATTAAVMTTLTSTASLTTIFGVGGGSLYAYKTHRRTQGLTEFEFQRESCSPSLRRDREAPSAELFTTICLSGWLRDIRDFQRPWGVTPTTPPITDKLERLERFYSIYKPDNIPRCAKILQQWKGEERQLWAVLRSKYGRDPDRLFPLDFGPRHDAALDHEEEETLDTLLSELGYSSCHKRRAQTQTQMQRKYPHQRNSNSHVQSPPKPTDSVVATVPVSHFRSPAKSTSVAASVAASVATTTSAESTTSQDDSAEQTENSSNDNAVEDTVKAWDYFAEYGGELYTVRWESKLLMELCDSVVDVAVDLVQGAAYEVLKQTVMATLITAVAWPYAMLSAANMIDGSWTLAIERADKAGIELARTLLESQAGHRPVVLVGFSMGARTIYSCLKELSRHQLVWEQQHNNNNNDNDNDKNPAKIKNQKKNNNNTANNEEQLQYTREPASIVEDAILMGTPNHLSVSAWEDIRMVVAGRLVNCYSRKDLILSLMFQFKRLSGVLRPVCGNGPVNVTGVEDIDVTHLISSHSDYCLMAGQILRLIQHGQPLLHPIVTPTTTNINSSLPLTNHATASNSTNPVPASQNASMSMSRISSEPAIASSSSSKKTITPNKNKLSKNRSFSARRFFSLSNEIHRPPTKPTNTVKQQSQHSANINNTDDNEESSKKNSYFDPLSNEVSHGIYEF